ncbi:MAG: hypothetical protein KDA74_10040, partial [Planctomycetaceae bacterium]|nr:hypothetical protein [Planctomycetaceae bacterium]
RNGEVPLKPEGGYLLNSIADPFLKLSFPGELIICIIEGFLKRNSVLPLIRQVIIKKTDADLKGILMDSGNRYNA